MANRRQVPFQIFSEAAAYYTKMFDRVFEDLGVDGAEEVVRFNELTKLDIQAALDAGITLNNRSGQLREGFGFEVAKKKRRGEFGIYTNWYVDTNARNDGKTTEMTGSAGGFNYGRMHESFDGPTLHENGVTYRPWLRPVVEANLDGPGFFRHMDQAFASAMNKAARGVDRGYVELEVSL